MRLRRLDWGGGDATQPWHLPRLGLAFAFLVIPVPRSLLCEPRRNPFSRVQPPCISPAVAAPPPLGPSHPALSDFFLSPRSLLLPVSLDPCLTAFCPLMHPGDFPSFIYLGRCYQLISFISPLPLVLNTGPSVPVLLTVYSPTTSQPLLCVGQLASKAVAGKGDAVLGPRFRAQVPPPLAGTGGPAESPTLPCSQACLVAGGSGC